MRALLPPSFAAAVVASSVVATTCGAAGCATTPSPEDRKAAGGHYEVALAFETVDLAESGSLLTAFVNMAGSAAAGLAAVYAGLAIGRNV